MKPYQIDSVIANVYNLETVCRNLYQRFGFKPFMRMHVPIKNESVPMALFKLGETTLEFLEYATHPADQTQSGIDTICFTTPAEKTFLFEIEPGLTMQINPAEKTKLTGIKLRSSSLEADLAVYNAIGGTKITDISCVLENVHLDLNEIIKTQPSQLSREELAHTAGWRRFSLTGEPIQVMVERLQNLGCTVVEPVFEVMPGLEEAFLVLPSGVMVQPVQENLLKLIPSSLWRQIFKQKGK